MSAYRPARFWLWRYGIGLGHFGRWGFYVGVPFVGDARHTRVHRGYRWIGIFW